MSKDLVTKVLSDVSSHNPSVFLSSIRSTENFAKKISKLTDSNSQKLRHLFAHSRKGSQFKADQNYYFLWVLLHNISEDAIECNKEIIINAIIEMYRKIQQPPANYSLEMFLYDIKIMDSEKHKKYMGVPNDIILENIKRLSDKGSRIFVRVPVIPGINDDLDNIKSTAEFLSHLNIMQVNILPYHNMAIDKYNRLSREYKLNDTSEPDDNEMSAISHILEDFGLNVRIGG
jgi:hypothetical protein